MDRLNFDRCMNSLLVMKDIQVSKEKNLAYFTMMKNDFSNEEFVEICADICKTEKLFNKYPDPCLFYQRKPKPNHTDRMGTEKQAFISKVSEYLDSGFICSDERRDFNNSLTETERKVLQRFGGISELWSSCHRDEYARSVDAILRDLKRDFDDLWEVSNKGCLQLTYGTPQNVKGVTQQLLSKWSVNDEGVN